MLSISEMIMKRSSDSVEVRDYESSSVRLFTAEVPGLYVIMLKNCNEHVSVVISHNYNNFLDSITKTQHGACLTYSATVQMTLYDYILGIFSLIGDVQSGRTFTDIDLSVALVKV